MNSNIRTLISVCERFQVDYQIFHASQNVLQVSTPNGPQFFVNWSTPLNDHTTARLCEDKDYTQTLLRPVVNMPRTRAYLDPGVNPVYERYRTHSATSDLADQIEEEFEYPFIVKRNRGSHGTNVFCVYDRMSLDDAIGIIFDKNNKDYDFVLLAQEQIQIHAEYRAVFLDGEQIFSYRKDTSEASFQGNLSPFRWANASAVLEEDPERLAAIGKFMQPIWDVLPTAFVGADVALDLNGELWLIELNSAPAFNFFIQDCGVEKVEMLYEKMLRRIGAIDAGLV